MRRWFLIGEVGLRRAQLLKRVFDVDLAHCPHCGGEVTLRALKLGAIGFVAKPKIGVPDGLRLLVEDSTAIYRPPQPALAPPR